MSGGIRSVDRLAAQPRRVLRPSHSDSQPPLDQFSPAGATPQFPTRAELLAIVRGPSEAQEARLLGGANQPGRLVPLVQGRNGAVVTIHGVNSAPDTVNTLAEPGVRQGQEVHTFAYDDRFRRLTDTSQDLANQLGEWLQRNPGQPLNLRAHSMGGRVALGALGILQQREQLAGRAVNLDLVAPPLGGFAGANWARADVTGALGGVVPVVRPGRDMGSTSQFQETLENLRLPNNVRTRIFLGGQDSLVDSNLPGFQRIQRNLQAEVIRIPNADHNTILTQLPR